MKRMHETNGRYMDVYWHKPRVNQPSAIKMGIAAKMPDGSVVYSADKEVLFCAYQNVDGEHRWHYFRKPNGPLGTENQFTFDQDVSTATRVMVDIQPIMGVDTITNIPTAEFTDNYYKDAQQQITQWYKENKGSDIYYDSDEDVTFAILNKGTEWQTNPNLPKVISVSWRAFPPEVIHKPKMGIYMLPVDYLEI